MALKDEINQLRAELGSSNLDNKVDDLVRKGKAKLDEGLGQAESTLHQARSDLNDTPMPSSVSATLSDALTQIGGELEKVPAKYPMLTALGALGVGLAVGLSLGRRR